MDGVPKPAADRDDPLYPLVLIRRHVRASLALVVPDGIHNDLIERGDIEHTRAVAGHR